MKFLFASAVSLCLFAQSLMGADDMSSNNGMMGGNNSMMMQNQQAQDMTEGDLLKQMTDQEKATYQKLSSDAKALMLKMVNSAKTNSNSMMMMMQKSMDMMQTMMTKMETMMTKMETMEKNYMMNMNSQKK